MVDQANLFSYIMPPAAIETRFGLSTSSLVSLVLFHAGLKAQTPLAGVFTLADRIMIGAYISVLASLLLSSVLITLYLTTTTTGEPHPTARAVAMTIFENTRLLGPLLSVFLFLGAFTAHLPPLALAASSVSLLGGCGLLTGARYWLARYLRDKGGTPRAPRAGRPPVITSPLPMRQQRGYARVGEPDASASDIIGDHPVLEMTPLPPPADESPQRADPVAAKASLLVPATTTCTSQGCHEATPRQADQSGYAVDQSGLSSDRPADVSLWTPQACGR